MNLKFYTLTDKGLGLVRGRNNPRTAAFVVLSSIYGTNNGVANPEVIQHTTGIDAETIGQALRYLSREGLIERIS
jgi:hypothetical protein